MKFQQRLERAMVGGNLRIADMARWFERPHATLSSWVKDGREPMGTSADIEHVNALLGLLETMIAKKRELPIPAGMTAAKRNSYLADLRSRCFPK